MQCRFCDELPIDYFKHAVSESIDILLILLQSICVNYFNHQILYKIVIQLAFEWHKLWLTLQS